MPNSISHLPTRPASTCKGKGDKFIPLIEHIKEHGGFTRHIVYFTKKGRPNVLIPGEKGEVDPPLPVLDEIAHITGHLIEASYNGRFLTHDDEPQFRTINKATGEVGIVAKLTICECCSKEAKLKRVSEAREDRYVAHLSVGFGCEDCGWLEGDCDCEKECEDCAREENPTIDPMD